MIEKFIYNEKQTSLRLLFVFWSGEQFGGLQRRYIRLAEYIYEQRIFSSITILCQKRCEKQALMYLKKTSHKIVKTFGCVNRANIKVMSLYDLFALVCAVRSYKNAHVHLCINPGMISGFVCMLKKKKQKASVSNAYLKPDLPLKISEKLGAIVSLLKVVKVDCLSKEPVEVIHELMGQKKNKSLVKKLVRAPCSFTDLNKIKSKKMRDIDVVMMARFIDGKGYDLIKEIDDFFLNIKLHLCGAGPKIIDIVNGIKYETDQPFDILSRTKIFLSLQETENYPSQSLLEAMASGCAIVATDVGETRKLLDENCAILIDYDASQLKEAVSSLLKSPELCFRLGAAAKKRIFSSHTIDHYAKHFISEIVG